MLGSAEEIEIAAVPATRVVDPTGAGDAYVAGVARGLRARADNAGFLIDGMNNTQRRNTGSMVSPPLEGVQEFKMITSGFAAEYGRYAGGVLSVILKSGGSW